MDDTTDNRPITEQMDDYDKVMALLSSRMNGRDVQATMDMADLMGELNHWTRVYAADHHRSGNPYMSALMSWAGMSVRDRLPIIFEAVGLNPPKA